MQDRLRRLPKVQSVLDSEGAAGLIAAYGYDDVANAVRAQVQEMRDQILSASATDVAEVSVDAMLTRAEGNLANARVATLRPVINATGIIIHTNLGRARLAPEAIDAMQEVALNYSTLELDIETGKRGSRHAHGKDDARLDLLFDPQTCGGLLATIPAEKWGRCQADFQASNDSIWQIGTIIEGPAKIRVA